jgi:hypothetical protein
LLPGQRRWAPSGLGGRGLRWKPAHHVARRQGADRDISAARDHADHARITALEETRDALRIRAERAEADLDTARTENQHLAGKLTRATADADPAPTDEPSPLPRPRVRMGLTPALASGLSPVRVASSPETTPRSGRGEEARVTGGPPGAAAAVNSRIEVMRVTATKSFPAKVCKFSQICSVSLPRNNL